MNGQRDGRDAVPVGRRDIGSGLNQQRRHLLGITLDGPVKSRRAVNRRRVDVDTLVQQCTDSSQIGLSDGLDQRNLPLGTGPAHAQGERQQPRRKQWYRS